MQSNLTLQFLSVVTQIVNAAHLPHFSNWQIPHATLCLYSTSMGQLLQQSSSNYLIHSDLFEYSLTEDLSINFVKGEPAIVMVMLFEGKTTVTDQNQQFSSEIKASSYQVSYIDKGSYTIKLNAGIHKLLVFTLRPDWFIKTTSTFPEFKKLAMHYLDKSLGIFSLPNCALNKNMVSILRKALLKLPIKGEELFFGGSNFLMPLLVRYQKTLLYDNFITTEVYQAKAAAILNFIQQNFTESIVEDYHKLARHFGISITSLYRLSLIAFGKPIRKQIIVLRMDFAMILITRSNQPIHKVALLTGYNDSHYFNRAFKKHFNQSPGSIRKTDL